jgi:hypothetical protein
MMLAISLYFFVFFYIIKLTGINKSDLTSNRRESVYTHKQKEINYTCLDKRLRDVFKKTNTLQHHNIFINKSEGEIKVHFTKCNTNKENNLKVIKCDVKGGLNSGECNKNNIYNIYNKIIMISKNDSSKPVLNCH